MNPLAVPVLFDAAGRALAGYCDRAQVSELGAAVAMMDRARDEDARLLIDTVARGGGRLPQDALDELFLGVLAVHRERRERTLAARRVVSSRRTRRDSR